MKLEKTPSKIHFTVIDMPMFMATRETEKRIITFELTQEQREFLNKRCSNYSFLDVFMSFEEEDIYNE